jgi:hypothetical protein
MASFQQVRRHVMAHAAKADKSDFHENNPFW